MRTAIYIRVSTMDQVNEGFSISGQKRQLTAYCESQGWDIVGYYVEEGVSAKDTKRPELQRMLDHIKNGLIDVVLVYKLDRLTRSVLDLYQLLQTFEENDCKFKSATEVYDTTSAIGRMFITLVASFAQFERERLSERVSFGMEQMTKEGKWKGGKAGFGHDYIDGEMVINEQEADILRSMYDWYMSGMSDRDIAVKLNNSGITTKKGLDWSEAKVRYALTNKKNIGNLEHGVRVNQDKGFVVEGVYPPVIDEHTFNRANMLRKGRNKNHGRQATSNYVYSGSLVCARCGKKFKGTKTRGNKRYVCIGKYHKTCDMPTMSEKVLEHNFIKELKQFDIKGKTMEIKGQDFSADDNKKIKKLQRDLENIKKRRKKWQYAWANDIMSDNDFQSRMQEEQENEENIKEELQNLNYKEPAVIDNEIVQMIDDAIKNWEAMDDVEKKQMIQITVDKIVVERVEAEYYKDRVSIQEIVFN